MKKETGKTESKIASVAGGGEVLSAADMERLKEEHWMFGNFLEGLKDGIWRPTTEEEIRRMVDERFFSSESLTALSKEEESLLKEYAVDNLKWRLNGETLELLVGEIYYQYNDSDYFKHNLFTPDQKDMAHGAVKKLMPEEKFKLFLDPDFWLNAELLEGWGGNSSSRGPIKSYGNRGINESDHLSVYAYQSGKLAGIIEKKSKARVLDIGSSMGLALHDIKQEFGDGVEVHGFSAEQEVAMYPLDFQYYGVAERMPKEFEGKFDLVFSNMAFRYFLFQHLGLRNAVKALCKDGTAELHFSYNRGPEGKIYEDYFKSRGLPADHYNAEKKLAAKEMKKLKTLRSIGLIDFKTSEDFTEYNNQGVIRITKKQDFDYEKETE